MQKGFYTVRKSRPKKYISLPHITILGLDVSIIITTYNESKNIRGLIQAIIKEIPAKCRYEIIVADDNSPDGTSKIVESMAKKDRRVTLLSRIGYRGVLSAILDAIKFARGKYVLTMDADFSHPPEKVAEIIRCIRGYDMVIGSRYAKGGGVQMPFVQRTASIALNAALKLLLSPRMPVTDFTGVFHAMDKKKFEKLEFTRQARWGEFDSDLIYKAYRSGWKMKEIPFVYKYRRQGQTKSGGTLKYGTVYFFRALKSKFGK